jgi:hypothetical protein
MALATFLFNIDILGNFIGSSLDGISFDYSSRSESDSVTLPSHAVPYSLLGYYAKIEPITISFSGCTFRDPTTGYSGSASEIIRALKLKQRYLPLTLLGSGLSGVVMIQSYSCSISTDAPLGNFDLTLQYYDIQENLVDKVGFAELTEEQRKVVEASPSQFGATAMETS